VTTLMRPQALKQMPLRRYLAAMVLAICTFSATGCDNWSFRFKGPTVELPGIKFNSGKPNPLKISGGKKYQAGDYEGALKVFNKLIKEEPNNAFAYLSKARTNGNLGKLQEAFNDANKAIELDPNLAEAYDIRGVAKAKMGNPGGAILDYNRAIERDENLANAYSNRGVAKSELGNQPGALVDINKALEIDPKFARGYTVRALSLERQGNLTDACKDLKKASSLGDPMAIDILEDSAPGTCK